MGHREWEYMGEIKWGKLFTFGRHKDGFLNYILSWMLKIADCYIKAI